MADELMPEHAEATSRYDKFAEQAVLGCMMLDVRAVWEVIALCTPSDFFDGRHVDIGYAIVALAHRNEPTEPGAVVAELEKTGTLKRCGGAAYVWELSAVPSVWSTVGHYTQIVLDAAIRRRLVDAGQTILEMGNTPEGEPLDQVETARSIVDAVTRSAKVDVRPIGDSFEAMIDGLAAPAVYVPTPWHELNDMIGGLRPGKLYVIGARPGSGKSIVGMELAMQMAMRGKVAFASLEMSEEDLQKRLLAMIGQVDMRALMNSDLSTSDWEQVARVRARVMSAPIYIDDRGSMNITQIKAFARSVARKGALSGVVVDYLQLMTGRAGSERTPRHEIVGEFSRELKTLSKELDVPVVALSQLNRDSTKRQSGKPTLADLRESGTIEQDADAVILLNRDEHDARRRRFVEMIVAKNRHGLTGAFDLNWRGDIARIESKSSVWVPPPDLAQKLEGMG